MTAYRSTAPRWMLTALLIALPLGLGACGDDDSGNDNNNQVQQDAAVQQDATVQQDAAPPALSSSHDGWGQADCASCHTQADIHSGQYDWPDCTSCHGFNGSSSREYPSGHHTTGCLGCHSSANSGDHAGYSTYVPQGCIDCHNP